MDDAESDTSSRWKEIEFVLCDLDGVVWLAHEPIPGAADAIARLRDGGRRVLFVTNNSMSTVTEQEAALAKVGVPASGDVVTSAQAGAALVHAGERVVVCGGRGVVDAVEQRGADAVSPEDATDDRTDVVVVGLDRSFTFERLHMTSQAIRNGARFVATNDDATFPTPTGLTPGGGSIVAAVATAAGRRPEIAGKPHRAMADLVAERCGSRFAPSRTMMIGDRWDTDGAFAETIGCPFALVRSGVTPRGHAVDGAVAIDATDLAQVADELLH